MMVKNKEENGEKRNGNNFKEKKKNKINEAERKERRPWKLNIRKK